MSTITNQTTETSPGTYFAHLFKVDADQYQLHKSLAFIGTANTSIVPTN